eukprot:Clim_evm9s218 gene=Clim_evmTU9s218
MTGRELCPPPAEEVAQEVEMLNAIYGECAASYDSSDGVLRALVSNETDQEGLEGGCPLLKCEIDVTLKAEFPGKPDAFSLLSITIYSRLADGRMDPLSFNVVDSLKDRLEEDLDAAKDSVFSFLEVFRQGITDLSRELHSEQEQQAAVQEALDQEKNAFCDRRSKGSIPFASFEGEIYHSEPIVDRKSTFQGHAATVYDTDEAMSFLHTLIGGNKKIQAAYHNMWAYRCVRPDKPESLLTDCDDDGEDKAGGRLSHLLDVLNVQNGMVVVSRWYGGIHLGPDRFKHINNCARNALEAGSMIPEKYKASNSKK